MVDISPLMNVTPTIQKPRNTLVSDLKRIFAQNQVNNDAARTEFQFFIRFKRNNVVNLYDAQIASRPRLLYDHRPMELNIDDFGRVCPIPRKKGENFRDLPGVLVGDDNKVIWDPSMERVKLKSGKPLVPDYAMKFVRETSTKYIQVGNAVAVPVGIALGYTFGLACQGLSDDQPLTKFPFKFPNCLAQSSPTLVEGDDSD
ncbi:hypothetical protein ACOSQ3_003796 [Xanthoceras sorbifolium]